MKAWRRKRWKSGPRAQMKLREKPRGDEMNMAVVEVAVIPMGTKTPSVSKYVARAVKVLESEKNIKYELTSMGTIIEGDLEKVLSLARKMHESVFGKEVSRVVTVIKIDDRRDKSLSIEGKLKSVKEKLGEVQ